MQQADEPAGAGVQHPDAIAAFVSSFGVQQADDPSGAGVQHSPAAGAGVSIADEQHQTGTVDHTPVYPREVVKRALELSATAVILVHNHPSGDPTPSRADVEMTRAIVEVARPLGIAVHDHIVVGKDGHASLKALKLI